MLLTISTVIRPVAAGYQRLEPAYVNVHFADARNGRILDGDEDVTVRPEPLYLRHFTMHDLPILVDQLSLKRAKLVQETLYAVRVYSTALGYDFPPP